MICLQVNVLEKYNRTAKICLTCWSITKEFNAFYLKVEQQWNIEILQDVIKTEVNVEPIECSVNADDFGLKSNFKLESDTEEIDYDIFQQENSILSAEESQANIIEVGRAKKRTTISESHAITSTNERKLSLDAENQMIREYFKMNCGICDEHFENFRNVQSHFQKMHNSSGYLICCGKKFYRRGLLLDHVSRHVDPDKFK